MGKGKISHYVEVMFRKVREPQDLGNDTTINADNASNEDAQPPANEDIRSLETPLAVGYERFSLSSAA